MGLLARADHLVLVLPYSSQVRHLIDATALAKMKPTATLTNIARGGLIDEDALADALEGGRLAAAGLDVFEGEPAVNPRLLALRNVVLTPHIASGSLATRRAMVSLAVDNLIAALGRGPDAGHPPSPVNADALKLEKPLPCAGRVGLTPHPTSGNSGSRRSCRPDCPIIPVIDSVEHPPEWFRRFPPTRTNKDQ